MKHGVGGLNEYLEIDSIEQARKYIDTSSLGTRLMIKDILRRIYL